MVAGCRFPSKKPLDYKSSLTLAREVVPPTGNKYAVLGILALPRTPD
jgi:hypothetical protein